VDFLFITCPAFFRRSTLRLAQGVLSLPPMVKYINDGYTHVAVLKGGVAAWKEAGFPIVQ
jgi:hypothetical protein